MKKIKNKVTHEVHLMIVEKSKALPVQYKIDNAGNPKYGRGTVDGSEIDVDAQGNRGIAGVKYTANVLQYENHFEKLMQAYQADGMTGFNKYVAFVEKIHAERQKFVLDAQPWYVKLWRFIKFWSKP
jgi:hypothetical protein